MSNLKENVSFRVISAPKLFQYINLQIHTHTRTRTHTHTHRQTNTHTQKKISRGLCNCCNLNIWLAPNSRRKWQTILPQGWKGKGRQKEKGGRKKGSLRERGKKEEEEGRGYLEQFSSWMRVKIFLGIDDLCQKYIYQWIFWNR